MDIDARAARTDAARVSLAEMLVAVALTASVLATTYTILDHGMRAYSIGAARAEAQQSARAALFRLAREIRATGRGGDQAAFPAIVTAEETRIVLESDLDGDGTTTARGEQITWQLVGDVLRRSAGAGAQPVVNGVRRLALRYFDRAGRPTAEPDAIRIVDVTLVVGHDAPGGGVASGVSTTLTTRIRLRNR